MTRFLQQDPCARSCQRAFTLVELLLVLTLISIVSGSIVVSFCGRKEAHALRQAARDLEHAISYIAAKTAQTRRVHRLVFSGDQRTYRLEGATDLGGIVFAPVRGVGGRNRALPDGVRVVSVQQHSEQINLSQQSLVFGGSETFSGTIELTNRLGETVRFEIHPETAQISIIE